MRILISALLLPLCWGCAKKQSTPLEQIPKLTKLEDVMDNQATVADPLFKIMNATSFTDDQFKSMEDASARLQVTAPKIKDFAKGTGDDRRWRPASAKRPSRSAPPPRPRTPPPRRRLSRR